MTAPKPKSGFGGKAYLLFYAVIAGLCLLLLLARATLHPATVVGDSMDPTYRDGQIVSTAVFDCSKEVLHIGDVVIFDSEEDGRKLIKRVVAVGGDVVQIRDGLLYLNGRLVKEDYPRMEQAGIAERKVTVPENSVFCLGDNRNNSTDSRMFGCVPYGDVDYIVKGILFG